MEEEEAGKMKGFVENMSEKVESLETQKKSLRDSIFSVFFELKGFEEQIVSTQNCFKQGLSQLESNEKELRSVQDSLSEIFKEINSERESINKKAQEVEDKEKEFKLFSDIGITKLNKEREDFCKEVEFRESNFREREKSLEDLLKKLEIERDEIEGKKAKIMELNKESEEFLKEIESNKDEILEGLKEMERRRVEIEGKEEKIMILNKERDDFFKEIEFRKGKLEIQKDEIEEIMKEMERRKEEIVGKEEEIMKREKKVEANEKEMELMIERQREVDLKVKDVDLMIEDILFKEKDVGLFRSLNEKRSKELDMREKQLAAKVKDVELFRNLNEKRSKELDMREKQLAAKGIDVELFRNLNEKRSKELDMREKQLAAKVKDVEMIRDSNEKRSKELDMREKQLAAKVKDVELIRDSNEKRSNELDMREEQLGAKVKDVELIRDSNEKRSKDLDTQEEQLGAKVKDAELMRDLNEGHLKQLGAKVKDVELIRDLNEGRSKELDMWEKQLGAKESQLQMVIQKLEEQLDIVLDKDGGIVMKKLNLETEPKEKVVQSMNIETNEKHSKEPPLQKCKELDSSHVGKLNDQHHTSVKEAPAEEPKERQLHKRIHEENCNENHLKNKEKSPSLVGKGIREEGYNLHKFLLDHGKELNSVVHQVIMTIQQSKEPAKLVLTAVEELYNRVITEKETDEKKDIAFRSCILLLEQLMKLYVDPHLSSVKDEALKFARVWRDNMKIRDSLEVLGFLYLLASYKLVNAFPIDVVIRFLEVVAMRRKTRDLCRRLDLKNNIQDLITELIKKNRNLLAFDYVHELELVDVFPPVALLKRHVLSSSMEARKTGINNGKRNPEAEDKAMAIEISALKDVVRCIMHRSLQAEYPPDELNERIEFLERQRVSLKESSPENQKVDSCGSANTQHDNTNCPSKNEQKKRRRLDRGGGYNSSELPPPSKSPRHVPPPEVNQSEGHRSGKPASRHPDDTTFHSVPYSPRRQLQQQSPRHVPLPEGHRSGQPASRHPDDTTFQSVPYSPRLQQSPRHVPPPEGHRSGKPSYWHPDDTTFHTGPFSPRRQQQQHNQSPRLAPTPEGHRSVKPSSRHPDDTTFHPEPYSPRWQQQQHNQGVSDLVNKYLTPGNRGSMYPAHHLPHVEQPTSMQSVTMLPRQPNYPAHPSYIR